MLRDEVKLFERLSGESANDVTIERLGSFLDGYFVGKEESVVHAHWRWMRNHDVICSKCQYVLPSGSPVSDFRFCPWCGAKMDEEAEANE